MNTQLFISDPPVIVSEISNVIEYICHIGKHSKMVPDATLDHLSGLPLVSLDVIDSYSLLSDLLKIVLYAVHALA
jgi:hypothetical protein